MVRADCPSCGKSYNFADEHAGKTATCPNCKAKMTIPRPAPAEQLPPAPPPLPASARPTMRPAPARSAPAAEYVEAPIKTSGLAVAALIFALFGFCFPPLGLIGLILGIVAINRIDNPANRVSGRGLATASAVLGGISLVFGAVVLFLAIGIMIPAAGAARRTSHQMQNSTQVRGIHQGHILYSQGNNGYYAGLSSNGLIAPGIQPQPNVTYGAQDGNYVSIGYAQLLNGNYFVPMYLFNPAETNPSITALTTQAYVTPNHYSYASSQVGNPGADEGRVKEFRDNTNTQAPVLGDRALDRGSEAAGMVSPNNQQSVWTTTNGDWRGSVVFGDNSTSFLTTSNLPYTKFVTTLNTNDNLFVVDDGAAPGADAFFVRN